MTRPSWVACIAGTSCVYATLQPSRASGSDPPSLGLVSPQGHEIVHTEGPEDGPHLLREVFSLGHHFGIESTSNCTE